MQGKSWEFSVAKENSQLLPRDLLVTKRLKMRKIGEHQNQLQQHLPCEFRWELLPSSRPFAGTSGGRDVCPEEEEKVGWAISAATLEREILLR